EEVGAAGEDEVGLGLDAADVLGLEERRPDQLAKLLVAEGRDAAVAIGILVPAEAGLVAGPANGDGVGEGADVAGRVGHQRHPAADAVAKEADRGGLLRDAALVPAVHLEGTVAEP